MSEGPTNPEEAQPEVPQPAEGSKETIDPRRSPSKIINTAKWRARRAGKDGGPNGPVDIEGRGPYDPDYMSSKPAATEDNNEK